VLKIHVVRQGGHRYYTDTLVPGRAEATGVAGEAPGLWVGGVATSLGATGVVGPTEFDAILGGHDPRSGAALRMTRGARSVAGYDLTFCAPKSVSILHLLGPTELAGEVGRGHAAAVAEATDYLQRKAVGVRRTHAGRTSYHPAAGVAAAAFLHRTSRALDPHLHTHLVVANVTQGRDGSWSAVDGRRLFAHVGAVQALYHARLRLELSERLGARFTVRPSGLGDVIGVDPTLRRLFSQRTADIEASRSRPAADGRRWSSRRAFHADRPVKDRDVTVEELVVGWRRRAADFGIDLGDLTRTVGPRRNPSDRAVDPDHVRRQLTTLADRRRTLAAPDVVAVVAAAAPFGLSRHDVEDVAARLFATAGPAAGPEGSTLSWASGAASGEEVTGVSRRSAADVLAALDRQGELLTVAVGRRRDGPDGWRAPDVVGRPTPRWDRDRSDGLDQFGEVSRHRSRAGPHLGR
jgi:conjugative relaxase-like TrwC/TraI family protein